MDIQQDLDDDVRPLIVIWVGLDNIFDECDNS